MAWCVASDFNEILCQSEKFGGKMRVEYQMARFREALENNELYDAGYVGNMFV